MTSNSSASSQDRSILIFLCAIMVLNATGIGLILPVMPALLQEIAPHLSLGQAAVWGGLLSLVYALMQFVMSPTLGNLSDRFGRRLVLLISLFLLALDQVLMAFAPSLVWLFIARLLSGGSAATYATANAVIADITPPEKRAARYGLLGACFGIGFVLGPLIGGYAGGLFGPRAPFLVASGLMITAGLFGLFAMPETLAKSDRRPFILKRANPFGAFIQMRKLPQVSWLLVAFFFFQVGHYVYPATWAYFGPERYGWESQQVGTSLFLVGLGFAFVQGGLIRVILPKLGEARTAYLGFCLNAATLGLISLTWLGWQAYVLLPLAALGAIATPALNGLMSQQVDADSQGELQGATAAITALVMMFLPISMNLLFEWAIEPGGLIYFPGLPFALAACAMAFALVPLSIGIARIKAAKA